MKAKLIVQDTTAGRLMTRVTTAATIHHLPDSSRIIAGITLCPISTIEGIAIGRRAHMFRQNYNLGPMSMLLQGDRVRLRYSDLQAITSQSITTMRHPSLELPLRSRTAPCQQAAGRAITAFLSIRAM